jgi:hypothetical protein
MAVHLQQWQVAMDEKTQLTLSILSKLHFEQAALQLSSCTCVHQPLVAQPDHEGMNLRRRLLMCLGTRGKT